jgi:arylsulfatase A-like enzyme
MEVRQRRPAAGVAIRLGATALTVATAVAPGCRRSEPPAHVILISADTLRADRLGAYGYTARPTSPRIDALAAEALLFEVHVAAAPWTTPSHLSLLTGLTPTRHGVTGSDRGLREALQGERPIERLPEAITTLAEALASHGYAAAAFTGGATLDPRIGFDQGFGEYDTSMVKLDRGKLERVLDWIDAHDEGPFFLFWHTFEVHAPYVAPDFLGDVLPPERARALGDSLQALPERNGWKQVRAAKRVMRKHDAYAAEVTRALYDGGVRSFDRWLGELLDGLRERGLYDRTLLVLTSDHGEQLGEEGRPAPFGDGFYNVHGHTLFEELIRIPLIVRLPGPPRGRRVAPVTASIDVMPTILDVLGLPTPPEVQGRSLRPLWESPAEWTPKAALSESLSEGEEMKGLRDGRFKHVIRIDADTVAANGRSFVPPAPPGALYDLLQDPGERRDLLDEPAEAAARRRAAAMGEELRRRLKVVGRPEEGLLSPEAREGLEALGYLE